MEKVQMEKVQMEGVQFEKAPMEKAQLEKAPMDKTAKKTVPVKRVKIAALLVSCLLSLGFVNPVLAQTGDSEVEDVAAATARYQLAFGSFVRATNAHNWAKKLSALLGVPIQVSRATTAQGELHRVVSNPMNRTRLLQLQQQARQEGLAFWRVLSLIEKDGDVVVEEVSQSSIDPAGAARPSMTISSEPAQPKPNEQINQQAPAQTNSAGIRVTPNATAQERLTPPTPVLRETKGRNASSVRQEFDWDLGLQLRAFAQSGVHDQARLHPSASLSFDYYYAWQDEQQSITFSPFLRFDAEDERRSHFDIGELYYTFVGSNWDVHVGAKKVFWGVTEFHHLIDIVNQTDLVENLDAEDKLGQPMVHLSLVGDWGLLDLYGLVGFRERTYAGLDGRLTHPLLISSDATYESGAKQNHVDAAIRWSQSLGPLELGLHHFSGTSRDPVFNLTTLPSGDLKLIPHYLQIHQSGVDAQLLAGDWAIKVEGMHRSGFVESYYAANLGVERTYFGIANSPADVGLVVEYMYDERGDDAFSTLFENDLVVGGRFSFNNYADTQLLLGLITDLDTQDLIFSVEGSHRIGQDWLLTLEGRAFSGGKSYTSAYALPSLVERDLKTTWLQEEDYIQLELKKYF